MPKKWTYVRLIANVLGRGAAGQHFVIGDEVSREMAEGWVSREIAEFTDDESVAQDSRSRGVEESEAPVLGDRGPLLQDASLDDILAKAETDLGLAGKLQLAEAIGLIRADLHAEYISMAEMARRVGVEAKEIQAAVDEGKLTRYEVDGGKKMLKADEAIAAWQAMQAEEAKAQAEEAKAQAEAEETRAPIEADDQGELDIDPALKPED